MGASTRFGFTRKQGQPCQGSVTEPAPGDRPWAWGRLGASSRPVSFAGRNSTSWERLMLSGSLGWCGRAGGRLHPPSTRGTHGAGGLRVPLSRAAFPKVLNLHCCWGIGLVGCSPRSRRTPPRRSAAAWGLPRARHNTPTAGLAAGMLRSPLTDVAVGSMRWLLAKTREPVGAKTRGLTLPAHFPGSGEIWGRGAIGLQLSQHAACSSLTGACPALCHAPRHGAALPGRLTLLTPARA